MNLFNSLRSRSFALLWSGQTVSRLGDSLYRIALSWWVLEKTGSATAMGLVQIFLLVPMLIFLLIGGVAADRFPRIRLMFGADVLRGFLVSGVALLATLKLLEVWHIYLISLAFGFVDAFFQPAYVAVIPEIAPAELLPSANSLNSLSGQLSGIIGPALGALIIAMGGTPAAFGLDALSFFISAAFLLPLLKESSAPKQKLDAPPPNAIRELREGLTAVFAQPWLWITIGLFGFINVTLAGPLAIALPFLMNDTLQVGVGGFGIVNSLQSAGFILGAIWLGRSRKMKRRGLLAYAAVIASGLCVLAMGLPITFYGVAAACFSFGVSLAIFSLVWTNVLQEMVPTDLLGRVSSVDQLGSFALLPLGYGLAGVLTDRIGAPLVFVGGGAISAILAGAALLHPAIRNLD